MPPEVVERVFEPFFTTKEVGRGTGLGLSMVYGFVKQSRGHVKIYSEVGHGTSIKLYLPRAASAMAEPPVDAPRHQPHPAAAKRSWWWKTARPCARSAVNMLRGLGYQVREAEDGKAALTILREPVAIDLLFTDLIMPNGIDGQELLVTARELRPGLKALFTSGYSEHFLKARGDTDADRAAAQQALSRPKARRERCGRCSMRRRPPRPSRSLLHIFGSVSGDLPGR